MALRRAAEKAASAGLLEGLVTQGRARVRMFSNGGSKLAPASSADPPFSYSPPGRNHLFVPGPVNIHERVRNAMIVPGENHRDPWFAPFYKSVLDQMKYLFQTKDGTPIIFPGTGTGGWEAALTNTLSPGDKVVTFRYGQFSHLWVDMQQRLGLDVIVVNCPWGDGAHEDKLAEILVNDKAKEIKAVCVVHNETATGITSDIPAIRGTLDAADHPALLLIDGVSSIGALPFKMDEWRVDVAVTGSQKALSLPTGLGFVCASPKALAAMETAQLKRVYYDFRCVLRDSMHDWFYWNVRVTNPALAVPKVATAHAAGNWDCYCGGYNTQLGACPDLHPVCARFNPDAICRDMLATNPSGGVPYTPVLPLLYGLREALTMMEQEGIENAWARHHRLAEGTRKAVAAWGLKTLCKDPRWFSDSLTVVETPEGIDSNQVVKNAFAKYNLSLGLGLSEVNGKVFRIGHLGNMDEIMCLSSLAGTEMAMLDSGISITPGSGVGAAVQYFQDTSSVIRTRECVLR